MEQEYKLIDEAVKVIRAASAGTGITASVNQKDNYNRIWARDSAVTGLAIISNGLSGLYQVLKITILLLKKAADANGQIPSNITADEKGNILTKSFGGPAGRTDTSFWWIIVSLLYLKKLPDEVMQQGVYKQCKLIFRLADNWEFNAKGLMYVPISSNWADEYITSGYVLYDQLLRLWALTLAGDFFAEQSWKEKAQQARLKIKQHFLLETELAGGLYTVSQQEKLEGFDLSKNFIASFTPGNITAKFDAWSAALLFLLNVPSEKSMHQLEQQLLEIFHGAYRKGIPAFWPIIKEYDPEYGLLKQNYSYLFKNEPGKFHNGGIWPVINGFLIAGLAASKRTETANILNSTLNAQLEASFDNYPFAEYFDYYSHAPAGTDNLCFSASGYLIAQAALKNIDSLKTSFGLSVKEQELEQAYANLASNLCRLLQPDPAAVSVITIAGESGCGKSTLSKALERELSIQGYQVIILHQDDYFSLPPQKNHKNRLKDFSAIGPQEVRLDLLDTHLASIKQKTAESIKIPVMNWLTDSEEITALNTKGVNVVIAEGTYTSLLKNTDCRIFINTTYQDTKQNRILRNRETVTDFIEHVLEKESSIISRHQELANIIINKELQVTDKNN